MQGIERMIQLLQQVQKQKGMFLFPLTVGSAETYLAGFRAASASCGFEVPRKLRQQVIESRGWKHAGAGPVPQMKDKGMADEAMIDELIEIEIEQLRRLAKLARPAEVAKPQASAPPPEK